MTAQFLDRLRQAIDQEHRRLAATVPAEPEAATLALLRAQDRLPRSAGSDAPPDLITGRRLANLGGNIGLWLCLASHGEDPAATSTSLEAGLDLAGWGERFLHECGHLAAAELVLGHCETGFMRLAETNDGTFDAWIATKRTPASWRERADIEWWAAWLARHHEPERDASYRQTAAVYLERMSYQLGYPPDAVIGGCTVQTYRAVLGGLIALALRARDQREAPAPQSESALIARLAVALAIDPGMVGAALAPFTLERESAASHAAVPGIAAAPLVRTGPDRIVWSIYGLTTEPLLFLTRELRRRDAEDYHNSAAEREAVFRQDLSGLFADKRFVPSATRIKLRRDDGDLRTDIDAVVFDRKTGTLGVFELKSQDPFARSAAEQTRRRDNVLYANRQISGVLAWLKHHGGDELLARVDARVSKTFRVHKVYPFVLGRYLAHFSDGPEPDRRAAWATWPQLLRLLDAQPFRPTDANPLASLFTRLSHDDPPLRPPADAPPQEIAIGTLRLVVHPSYAAFQGKAGG